MKDNCDNDCNILSVQYVLHSFNCKADEELQCQKSYIGEIAITPQPARSHGQLREAVKVHDLIFIRYITGPISHTVIYHCTNVVCK